MTIFHYTHLHRKKISFVLLTIFVLQIVNPLQVLALTSGPSQPEFQEFEPASTSEMVDLFSGDFTYNIPLFELPGPNGGYPFNLAYHAGISTDQEASWVGLGWSLNPGAITRQVRGLPDEFKGDDIETLRKMKPNRTLGVGIGLGTEIVGADALKADVGLTAIYNNNSGLSYTLDGGLGFSAASGSDINSTLRLGFSLNTNEGLALRPSLNLATKDIINTNTLSVTSQSIGLGYHSRYGLTDLSYGFSCQKMQKNSDVYDNIKDPLNTSFGASLSLASSGFTPSISHPMLSTNTAFQVSGGAAWLAIYPNSFIKGFANVQNFKNVYSKVDAFGYKNLQYAGENDMMDFNRERDGAIHKESPNLPIPVLTHDVYSVTGQGVGAMFKPMRTDMGMVHDNKTTSLSVSGSLGFDVGPAIAHFGGNFGLMFGTNTAGAWDLSNNDVSSAKFDSHEINSVKEPWYYKVRGEHSVLAESDYTGLQKDDPIGLNMTGSAKNPTVNWDGTVNDEKTERISRTNTVIAVTNEELMASPTDPVINLFKTSGLLERSQEDYPGHHVGGYITTNDDGLRYIYAIPVYNNVKEEVMFFTGNGDESTDLLDAQIKYKTKANINAQDEYYVSTKTPKYAHSYLLTAVVGPDYVDVGNNGIDEEDLGYWIKFDYQRYQDNYTWKVPYSGAIFQEGNRFESEDNTGSYQFGKKEIWHLDQVESKTHKAVFNQTVRLDNFSAIDPDGGVAAQRVSTNRLASIDLFAKNLNNESQERLLKVVFDNDHYELCQYTPNSSSGKLTLKGIHFEYGKSTKPLNEYDFGYEFNEDYNKENIDRWGFYKEQDGTLPNKIFPYVNQAAGQSSKTRRDEFAAMWSLTDISLPSGSKIHVDYEMDDYAYVQHKRPMKMVPITSASLDELKLNFDNEEGLSYQDYLDALDGSELYFRALVNMRDNNYEYVSGYITPKATAGQEGFLFPSGDLHPIKKRSFQHMRSTVPKLIRSIDGDINSDDFFPFVKIISAMGQEVKTIFQGFAGYADSKGWGNVLNTERSWIKLPVLKGYKYGGGHRVKKIIIEESDGGDVYGQVYDYTIEENGGKISSGVAQNEPTIGAEESPFRTVKKFTKAIPLHTNNNLFFEYPVNEGSFPGAGVGYRKVTVMSLASDQRSGTNVLGTNFFPDVDHGATGKVVHEFYTAKDFPTITRENIKQDKSKKRMVPIPFIGVNTSSFYSATQGYSIINNDMHGKLRKTSHFRILDNGNFETEPYAYSEYKYLSKELAYQNTDVNVLINEFVVDDNNPDLLLPSEGYTNGNLRMMGVEQEAVLDTRKYRDESYNGGFNFNIDLMQILFFPIPIPSSWPNVSSDITELKTAVSNKVIFKSGILSAMETMQDGATVNTEYLAWDALTGRPLLTKVKDQFQDNPIYSYSIPAYTQYKNMGAAYENLGLHYRVSGLSKIENKEEYECWIDPGLINENDPVLISGDEVVLRKYVEPASAEDQGSYATVGTAIYLGTFSGSPRIHSTDVLNEEAEYEAIIYRSGKRNHLSVDAGSVTSLNNPTEGGTPVQYNKTVIVPSN